MIRNIPVAPFTIVNLIVLSLVEAVNSGMVGRGEE